MSGGAGVAGLVVAVATDLLGARDELNRLDGVAGDGDLGLTVTNAARALIELAPSLEDLSEAIERGARVVRPGPDGHGQWPDDRDDDDRTRDTAVETSSLRRRPAVDRPAHLPAVV